METVSRLAPGGDAWLIVGETQRMKNRAMTEWLGDASGSGPRRRVKFRRLVAALRVPCCRGNASPGREALSSASQTATHGDTNRRPKVPACVARGSHRGPAWVARRVGRPGGAAPRHARQPHRPFARAGVAPFFGPVSRATRRAALGGPCHDPGSVCQLLLRCQSSWACCAGIERHLCSVPPVRLQSSPS